MNLLEHYIREIISIEETVINEKWAKGLEFVKVKMIVDCNGLIEEVERLFTKIEWEMATKAGYILA